MLGCEGKDIFHPIFVVLQCFRLVLKPGLGEGQELPFGKFS